MSTQTRQQQYHLFTLTAQYSLSSATGVLSGITARCCRSSCFDLIGGVRSGGRGVVGNGGVVLQLWGEIHGTRMNKQSHTSRICSVNNVQYRRPWPRMVTLGTHPCAMAAAAAGLSQQGC